jgi:hypothetical protein
VKENNKRLNAIKMIKIKLQFENLVRNNCSVIARLSRG